MHLGAPILKQSVKFLNDLWMLRRDIVLFANVRCKVVQLPSGRTTLRCDILIQPDEFPIVFPYSAVVLSWSGFVKTSVTHGESTAVLPTQPVMWLSLILACQVREQVHAVELLRRHF